MPMTLRPICILAALLVLLALPPAAGLGITAARPLCAPSRSLDFPGADANAASTPKQVALDDRSVEVGTLAAHAEVAPAHYTLALSCLEAGDPAVSYDLTGSGPASGGAGVDPPSVHAEPGLPDGGNPRPREVPQ